jgi:hypothetical protein
VETGRAVSELDQDDRFLSAVAEQLRRPWLAPPRVIVEGEVRHGAGVAERTLARTAIHVYAGLIAGVGGLGDVPPFPPPDPEQDIIWFDHMGSRDGKDASFDLSGQALDVQALTDLTGLEPEWSWRRGDIRMDRQTGRTYHVRREGRWVVTSDGSVERVGPSLEDHLVWLLERLEPHATALTELIIDLDLRADFRCAYFQRQENSMWELSADTLRRIAALRASITYDAYIEVDDEDQDDEG